MAGIASSHAGDHPSLESRVKGPAEVLADHEPLKCLADSPLPHRPFHVAIGRGSATIVASSPQGVVTVLSSGLRVVGAFDLQAKVDGISISSDGEFLGISLKDRICITTISGEIIREVPHSPWGDDAGGGCTFSPDGRSFWAVRPGVEDREVTIEVLDCDGWPVVATATFEADEEGDWTIAPHPEGRVVGAWLGAGQDGQWLYWCGIEDDWLYVEEEASFSGTGPPVFHPAGAEFLTDDLNEGILTRHRFPSGTGIGELSQATLFPPEDDEDQPDKLSGMSAYVSDARGLVLSDHGRVWLLDLGTMKMEGELLLEGEPTRRHKFDWDDRERLYGDVGQLHWLAPGRLLTVHRNRIESPANPDYRLSVWDMAPICGEMTGPDGGRPLTDAFFSHFLR